jgi:hypothetical protein
MLLVLFRAYLRRPLTALPVLTVGVVWFSLADVQNALWSFQLAWYLVLFFFVAMCCCFRFANCRHRTVLVALALVAAVLASLTEIQGFAVWLVGLLCLLWDGRRDRRTVSEVAVWLATAALTTAIYLRDFDTHSGRLTCIVEGGHPERCSTTYGFSHPVELARFMTALVGNVVPTRPGHWVGAHQVIGAAILVAAVFVVVRSVRERRPGSHPLPVLLIVFALQFDLMVAFSRLGLGVDAAGTNRYTMPNLLLLCGIVVFAWGRVGTPVRASGHRYRVHWGVVGAAALAALVVVQVSVATQFGITYGRAHHAVTRDAARIVANLDQIPKADRDCYLTAAVFGGLPPGTDPNREAAGRRIVAAWMHAARATLVRDELSLFRGNTDDRYREAGLPAAIPRGWWRSNQPAAC